MLTRSPMKKGASKRPFSSSLSASLAGKKRPGRLISPPGLKANPCISFLCTQRSKVEVNHSAGVRLCCFPWGQAGLCRGATTTAPLLHEGLRGETGSWGRAEGAPSSGFRIHHWIHAGEPRSSFLQSVGWGTVLVASLSQRRDSYWLGFTGCWVRPFITSRAKGECQNMREETPTEFPYPRLLG